MTARKATGKKKVKKTHAGPVASFDVISGSGQSNAGGNKRRRSKIETKGETGAGGILKPYDRLNALNLCRDAERNYSQAKSIIHQMKVNVIGKSPKAQINTMDEEGNQDAFGKEATEWLNSEWMKDCDLRQDRRFAKLAQLVVAAKAREGDLLVVFDDGLIDDSGKLLFYESDMICDISDMKEELIANDWTMTDGIVTDKLGREIGYAVTSKRGQTSVAKEEATIFSRDPANKDENLAKLIRSDYRLIQGRGISPLLSAISDFLDCYEMRSKELQSAKVAAGQFATVKRKEAISNFDDPKMDPENENPDDQKEGYEGEDLTLPEDQTSPANYEALEKLTGGYTEYIDEGDEVEYHDFNRPNVKMKDFIDYVMDSGGAAFGMAHAYTRLKAETSYTAFRGDMILTWVSIYAEQKDIEDEFLDWSAIRAINWRIKKDGFENAPTPGWNKAISWTLPTIPFVDEVKERNAHAIGLKNGELSYSQLLGPDWLAKLTQFSKELEQARALLLPLEVFETKAGAPATTDDDEPQPGDTKNE